MNRASARVLAAYGYEVAAPYGGCCGALALHAGRRQEGLELARQAAAAFAAAGCETIVTNAAGCGSHLKDAELELPVVDISRGADRAVARRELHPLERRVAFQESCHLGHAQRVRERAAGAPALDPGPRARRAGRAGALLRERRHLQPRPAGGRARRSATARPTQVLATEPGPLRERQPGLPDPGVGGAAARRATGSRPRIRSRCSTPRSAAIRDRGRVSRLGADARPAAHRPLQLRRRAVRGDRAARRRRAGATARAASAAPARRRRRRRARSPAPSASLQGEELLRAWEPPDGFAKFFCSACGSSLWSRSPDGESYGDPLRGLRR